MILSGTFPCLSHVDSQTATSMARYLFLEHFPEINIIPEDEVFIKACLLSHVMWKKTKKQSEKNIYFFSERIVRHCLLQ